MSRRFKIRQRSIRLYLSDDIFSANTNSQTQIYEHINTYEYISIYEYIEEYFLLYQARRCTFLFAERMIPRKRQGIVPSTANFCSAGADFCSAGTDFCSAGTPRVKILVSVGTFCVIPEGVPCGVVLFGPEASERITRGANVAADAGAADEAIEVPAAPELAEFRTADKAVETLGAGRLAGFRAAPRERFPCAEASPVPRNEVSGGIPITARCLSVKGRGAI
jgi:hypothetical protein